MGYGDNFEGVWGLDGMMEGEIFILKLYFSVENLADISEHQLSQSEQKDP